MNKKSMIKKNLILLVIILLILLPFKLLKLAHAEEEKYKLNAVLYDTDQYAGGTGTTLTNTGATVSGWEFNTSKYLQIIPNVPADGKTYSVSVTLPKELYIVGTELSTPVGFTDNIEFTKNENISVNGGNGIYEVNEFSGKVKYTLENMVISGTIQLEIRYDNVLWDKQSNSPITENGVSPIVVELIEEESGTKLKEASISKITSGSAASIGSQIIYYTVNSRVSTAVQLLNNQTVFVDYNMNSSPADRLDFYYKNLYIDLKLPEYIDNNGVEHYLTINESTIDLPSILTEYEYEVDKTLMESEGIVTIKIENAYYSYSGYNITFYFNPLEEELQNLDESKFPITFKNGSISARADSNNGIKNIKIRDEKALPNITYTKAEKENIILGHANKKVSIANRPIEDNTTYKGAVSYLGRVLIRNEGTEDSCEKTITYTFDTANSGLIKVTTVMVPADNVQQNINIKYTLVDENGERVYLDSNDNRVESTSAGAIGEWNYSLKNSHYNSSTISNIYNMLIRTNLPQKRRQYYFKTIEFNLETIKAGATLYSPTSNATFSSGGIILGYVSENATESSKALTNVKIVSSNSSIANKSTTVTTSFSNVSRHTADLYNLEMSKESISAGESLTVSGVYRAILGMYGNCTWVDKIRLGVILPDGVSINEQSIKIKNSSGNEIEGITLESRSIGLGQNLYTIVLPDEFYMGYATENLKVLGAGRQINFSFQLDTSYTMDANTLFIKDMLIACGEGQENFCNGTYNYSMKEDSYDLNSNGKTDDIITGVNSEDTTSCQIVSKNALLTIDDNIAITSNNVTSSAGNSVTMVNDEDTILYNLNIECTSGGKAPNLKYFIPIVKKDSIVDGFLIKDNESKFDLGLKETASVSGNELFNIEYTFDKNLTYTTAQECTNWYTKEQIEQDESLKLEDVTMVRITTKEGGINNGDSSKITLKLKYVGEHFYEEAGMKNTWCGGGYYEHITGNRVVAGNYTTVGVMATIEADFLNSEITLTAAKNMEPKTEGNVNEIEIDETIFPEFIKPQTFKIDKVETYNVALQTKENILTNLDMAASDANKTFAVTVTLGNGTEKNIVESTEDIIIGTSQAGKAPEFKFKLYNGNNLTDISTLRYIIVTLVSDNGVSYVQKININREIGKASDPKIAIISGKNYITFSETTDTTTISQDSSFTAQFVTEYDPTIYKNHIIEFSNEMPTGTTIAMLNLTDEENPKYYYYRVSNPVSSINFEDFKKMGSTNGTYDYNAGNATIEEKLLLIVDFSNVEENLILGTYNLKLKMESDIVETSKSKELNFITTNKREYTLTGDEETKFENEYSINYTVGEQQGSESKYDGRKLSLVVNIPNDIPNDTILISGGTTYYQNNNKQFIIQLGDITEKEGNIPMKFVSKMLGKQAQTYEIKYELWASGTANSEKPFEGEKLVEKIITLRSENKESASLKVKEMTTRAIHITELANEQTLTFDYIPAENCKATIELTQKIGSGYQKITDKLSKVNENTTHNIGVFDIEANEGTNTIRFRLSSETPIGTYRFILRVKTQDGKEILNVPYNFMVVEDL